MSDYLDKIVAELRDADAGRDRSQQTEVGWSEVASCRAAIGFKLQGEWETDDPDNWRAIVGTALHEHTAAVRGKRRLYRHEIATSYAGIPGHADEVDPAENSVTDWKFPTLAVSETWKRDGEVFYAKRAQVHGYAAGLIEAGDLVADGCTVRVVVAPVDGTFDDWWMHEEPFDPTVADGAVARVAQVEALVAKGLQPPRDMPYDWCQRFCEFFQACRDPFPPTEEEITDPEVAALVRTYGELGDEIRPKEKLRKKIAGEIRGLHGRAGDWTVGLTKPSGTKDVPDMDAIRSEYDERGEQLPTKQVPTSSPSLQVRRVKGKQ